MKSKFFKRKREEGEERRKHTNTHTHKHTRARARAQREAVFEEQIDAVNTSAGVVYSVLLLRLLLLLLPMFFLFFRWTLIILYSIVISEHLSVVHRRENHGEREGDKQTNRKIFKKITTIRTTYTPGQCYKD